ncbi:bifunctional folylpolyglutamate synthase/dihydrofolate synthase [Sphingobacterium phlebotomi]|uniref:bifunctional folylpolyglutamate synthase/dihydrofolate synthase n=1 Tax=Sphingobacterium phlebotomi TaxID=2605433 RepID=UPI001653E3A5|nr:folylpolyglutamate synthase/dihydrofolate synthase family protein [Sphingobacterium phlebotomi]
MIQTYDEVIEYLFARLPMFTRDGASAIKKDIDNTVRFCRALGNPHTRFKSIHVAGTNGKGSTSHLLASVLASAGYKTGLYTSPHLVDFRERIRINGAMIPQAKVIDFVNLNRSLIEEIQPSFFEVTVAMAFDYFAAEQVDVAIVEVGLGGRLDSTNILLPALCVITNIGMDHTDLLGNTLAEIAGEKAGIIKPQVPVVLSERDEAIAYVFEQKAHELKAPLRFASTELTVQGYERRGKGLILRIVDNIRHRTKEIYVGLAGHYQQKNILGVLTAVDELRKQGWEIGEEQLCEGLAYVERNTGLQGRWQTLSTNPLIICDTGHNEDGIREVIANIQSTAYKGLHIIIGVMRDKDISHMLPQLPKEAIYYFCNPAMSRALPADELQDRAILYGLQGEAYPSVDNALASAKKAFQEGDLIFVGGSNFVVAEVLKECK